MATQEEENTGKLAPDGSVEIIIEDDTPEPDRGRRPLKHDALSVDDEALMTSEKVTKRINELKHAAHDERRSREASERREAEAVRVAQQSHLELQALRKRLVFGEAGFGNERNEKAKLALEAAKKKVRDAYEGGDPSAIADAQAELSMATGEVRDAGLYFNHAKRNAENTLQQEKTGVESGQSHQQSQSQGQQGQPAQPSPRALAWAEANKSWYGTDPEMTALAHGVHERLVKADIHPVRNAQEYYKQLSTAIRQRFPEFDWDSVQDTDADDNSSGQGEPAKPVKTASTPRVAPVNRTSAGHGGKQVVRLTASQAALCERLNITPEQYAREYLKYNSGE